MRFAPGLHDLLRYDRSNLRPDLAAGLSVAAVALPSGVAYSDIVQVPAVVGIYAAIFPLFVYALFGSSRQLITGPDSATCVLVAATLLPLAPGFSDQYVALVVVLTLMTACFHLLAGLLRLGFLASFLSVPVLAGFLNGIALILIVGQLKTLFGYSGTADTFFATALEAAHSVGDAHPWTAGLGLSLLVTLVALRRWLPRSPQALIVVALGAVLVAIFGLDARGVAVVGTVPAGLPSMSFALPSLDELRSMTGPAATIALITFVSGVLTAKSWARRNRYEIDANRELFAFAACNLASGLGHGFPVSGTDSRTAVNNAMGGKTQMVGIVAGVAMLLVLLFLTAPLAVVPKTALAAVIVVSALGLIDVPALRALYATSRLEFAMSLAATAGVLVLGVLQGVALAVGLSLAWIVKVAARPPDAVLGRIPGRDGYYDVADHADAKPPAGALIYQFGGSLVFFNADYFKARVLEVVAASAAPVERLVLDMSAVGYVDVTAMQKLAELREELEGRGVALAIAHAAPHVLDHFTRAWVREHTKTRDGLLFPTVDAALQAGA